MRSPIVIAATGLLGVASCSGDEPSAPVDPAATIALTDARYGGEFVLRADSVLLAPGSAVTISIETPNSDEPLLSRSYDLGDPIWRFGPDGARLYFALDGRDAWPLVTGPVRREMELTARFDPDGNPATDEPGSVRVRLPVQTGSHSILVELALAPPVAVNPGRSADENVSDR